MNARTLKIALLASLGLGAAGMSHATDVTMVNSGFSQVIHPYFRSNCWNPATITPSDPKAWVFFGGVGPRSQFTWSPFENLIKPGCKHPVVRLTFALDGESPPTGKGIKSRTGKIEFDASTPSYTFTYGDVTQLVDVQPADADNDGDDD